MAARRGRGGRGSGNIENFGDERDAEIQALRRQVEELTMRLERHEARSKHSSNHDDSSDELEIANLFANKGFNNFLQKFNRSSDTVMVDLPADYLGPPIYDDDLSSILEEENVHDYMSPPIYDDYPEEGSNEFDEELNILPSVGQAVMVQRESISTTSSKIFHYGVEYSNFDANIIDTNVIDKLSLVEKSHLWHPESLDLVVDGYLVIILFNQDDVSCEKINVKFKVTADVRRRKVQLEFLMPFELDSSLEMKPVSIRGRIVLTTERMIQSHFRSSFSSTTLRYSGHNFFVITPNHEQLVALESQFNYLSRNILWPF